MNEYELAVILHPDLEIDLEAPLQRLEKLVASAGGNIIARDDWGKRKLAYPVKKQSFGLYFFYQLELSPESIADLERNLLISDELLRHLLVKALPPQEDAEDKPAPKAKSEEKTNPPAGGKVATKDTKGDV